LELFDPEGERAEPAAEPAHAPQPLAEVEQESQQDEPAPDAAPDVDASAHNSKVELPATPLLIGGGGLIVLGAGVVVGAMMDATQKDYAGRVASTPQEARELDELRLRGQREAAIASALLGVGAAALAVSGVWLALELSNGERPTASVSPDLGPTHAGLRVHATWGSP